MTSSGKIYFASDLHLGTPNKTMSAEREKRFVQWLDNIKQDATEVFLVGDLFDFWHEYGTVVPKGFVRLQGKIAELSDAGIAIHIFTGNHDLWMYGYFEEELGVKVYHAPITREWNGKQFFIGHGDGLGPGDRGYKFIKKIFANPVCQFLFKWLHPDIGVGIANYFSRKSRYGNANEHKKEVFKGEDKEWLVQYCHRVLERQHIDYFIFGHRHLPLDISIQNKSRYINLGDWLDYSSYAVLDGSELKLCYHKSTNEQ